LPHPVGTSASRMARFVLHGFTRCRRSSKSHVGTSLGGELAHDPAKVTLRHGPVPYRFAIDHGVDADVHYRPSRFVERRLATAIASSLGRIVVAIAVAAAVAIAISVAPLIRRMAWASA
jgi:hypothetical protein